MTLDRRLHAARPDLADIALKGKVEAGRFVAPTPGRITRPVVALTPRAEAGCGIDTELLQGEAVRIFEKSADWAWVQAVADGYVGYVPAAAVGADFTPTHRVSALRSFVYPGPDLRFATQTALSIGSLVRVTGEAETRGTRYLMLEGGGHMVAGHLQPVEAPLAADYVTIAGRFVETPYLWGGRSGFGLDCSALVQLSLSLTGRAFPRDTDLQAKADGEVLTRDTLRRGDLVFWKGHVGLMEDHDMLLHANGHTMTVAREPLDAAIKRIGWLYQQPTGYLRPAVLR